MTYPKRLIEVDLPIKRISAYARREKSLRHGHISTLHIWWARRPLAACRAVICASLWPDAADPLGEGGDVVYLLRKMSESGIRGIRGVCHAKLASTHLEPFVGRAGVQ